MKRIRAQYMINYPEHLRFGEYANDFIKKEINNGIINEMVNEEVIDYDNEVDCNGNIKYKAECFTASRIEIIKIMEMINKIKRLSTDQEQIELIEKLKNIITSN